MLRLVEEKENIEGQLGQGLQEVAKQKDQLFNLEQLLMKKEAEIAESKQSLSEYEQILRQQDSSVHSEMEKVRNSMPG